MTSEENYAHSVISPVNSSTSDYMTPRRIPVLFSTNKGLYLRKFSTISKDDYKIEFCDIQKWVIFFINLTIHIIHRYCI